MVAKGVGLVTTDMKVDGLVGDHTSEGVITAPTIGESSFC